MFSKQQNDHDFFLDALLNVDKQKNKLVTEESEMSPSGEPKRTVYELEER